MSDLSNKPAARAYFKSILESIDSDTRRSRSHRAAELLSQTPEFQNADLVMVFLSMREEIDTSQVALAAWEAGKKVVAPQVSWNARKLTPVEINSLSDVESISVEFWKERGIEGQPMPIAEIDLVLVPALGYSTDGQRLGRGLGFYDRFLIERDLRAVACGLGFEAQVVEQIPFEAHDARLKMLVTDEQVRRFS
ncbi:MAG TPA: 5-formyltetrahydrofolate cyclo-ligase [Tepidisphaeraceae bacterium]|nr:5-formyltetrahydrofolate cyclo-ligase [Tepidisphaeraceae bacterium]